MPRSRYTGLLISLLFLLPVPQGLALTNNLALTPPMGWNSSPPTPAPVSP